MNADAIKVGYLDGFPPGVGISIPRSLLVDDPEHEGFARVALAPRHGYAIAALLARNATNAIAVVIGEPEGAARAEIENLIDVLRDLAIVSRVPRWEGS